MVFRFFRARYDFEIEAIVILPDHLHTLWRLPDRDADFSRRWMVIKRKFSSVFVPQIVNPSKIKKREKGIWQRRFWEHYIRDEDDWRKHVDYIHFNPVKHGFVARPHDWPYSSFRPSIDRGWYPANVVLDDDFEGIGGE